MATKTKEQLQAGLKDCQKWGGCTGMSVEEYAKSLGVTISEPTTLTTTGKPEADVTDTGGSKKGTIDIDYSRATPISELPPATGEERFNPPGGATEVDAWAEAFAHYQEFVKAHPDLSLPVYRDSNNYRLHEAEWLENLPYYQAGYGYDQIDSFTDVMAYASRYGDIEDDTPKNLLDYLENYDRYQQQYESWRQEAGPEATGFTDAEIREYKDYEQWYYEHGKPGDPKPVDVGDYITNYETYQKQLKIWQQEATEAEQYEIDPAEKLRRQEEAYKESRYAAEERYGETPRYSEAFTGWKEQQGQFSNALTEFIESEFPSLRSQFEAGLPPLTGYPTREEARAESASREKGLQAWLGGQTPELEQKYWGQRPAQRGERLYMQSPNVRTINW